MQDNSLILCGRLSDNDLAYYARLCVTTDGEMVKGDGKLIIKDASYLVFALSAGTNYKNEYPNYRGEMPEGKVNTAIEDFLKKGYDEVKKEAIAEYKSLFDRFYLRLQASQAPNTRINSFLHTVKTPIQRTGGTWKSFCANTADTCLFQALPKTMSCPPIFRAYGTIPIRLRGAVIII